MTIDWSAISTDTWKVLLAGLAFGAGLPFLFAVGVRLWDRGDGGEHADGTITARKPVELSLAYLLFAIVGIAVIIGVLYITKSSIDHYLGIKLF